MKRVALPSEGRLAAGPSRRVLSVPGKRGHLLKPGTPEHPNTRTPLLHLAEISSFQLEWVETFAPRVAILTNITPDHLNRHASFEEYAETKARIFAAQTDTDWAVLNYDNPASPRHWRKQPARTPGLVHAPEHAAR